MINVLLYPLIYPYVSTFIFHPPPPHLSICTLTPPFMYFCISTSSMYSLVFHRPPPPIHPYALWCLNATAHLYALLYFIPAHPSLKADTHEGFCSRVMPQGHAAEAKLLRVYQRFHGYNSSSGAEFLPRKMLHDVKLVKYLGARSRGKLSKLDNAPSCLLTRAK